MEEKVYQKKTSHPDSSAHTRRDMAKEAGVGEGTFQRYEEIKDSNNPHLLKQVQEGKLKIGTAHRMLEERRNHA